MKKIPQKIISFFLLLFTSLNLFSQNEGLELQVIEHRPLTWQDFKAKPPRNSEYAAVTRATVGYDYYWVEVEGKNQILFDIQPYFIVNKSWAKYKTPALLEHEQGHYDLVRIFAYELRQQLQAQHFTQEQDYDAVIGAIVAERAEYYDLLQKKYDEETEHGLNEIAQKKWKEWIYAEIQRLAEKQ